MTHMLCSESGYMIEAAFQFLPGSDFSTWAEFVEYEHPDAVYAAIGELIMYLAERQQFQLDLDSYTIALRNIWLLTYCESLRRKDILSYTWHDNIFAPNENVNKLTTKGLQVLNDECRNMRTM